MLRTNLLAFGVGGAGVENFENPAIATTGLSCIKPAPDFKPMYEGSRKRISFSAIRTKHQAESSNVSSNNSRVAEELHSIS